MSCVIDGILSGWIAPHEKDQVQSSYDDSMKFFTVTRYTGATQQLLQNTVTGDFYYPDSDQLVAIKCLLMAIGAPFYTLGRVAFHTGRIFYLIYKVFEEAVINFKRDLESNEEGCSAFFKRFVVELIPNIFIKALGEQIFECIKAPYYGLGIFIAASVGFLHDPYKGKMALAIIERHWNWDISRSEDPRMQKQAANICAALQNSSVFYLAFCMQPTGNELDTVVDLRGEEVLKYKSKIPAQPVNENDGCCCLPMCAYAC